MASTREITYGSTANPGGQKIFSSATTWGELKKEDQGLALAASAMSAVISGQGGKKLVNDSDVLPEGNFSLYLMQEKNNSGNGIN
jgi:hypothetical protein